MRKVKLFTAVTLDGYIARPDGNLDWLNALGDPEGADYGYGALMASIDTVIMGRTTYQEVLGFGVEWPYSACDSLIVSSNPDLDTPTENTRRVACDAALFGEMKNGTGKDIWLVGGGKLVQFFLDHGLIDEMILSVTPIVLGEGIPLFPSPTKETSFELTHSESYANGIVNLEYKLASKQGQ